MTSSIKESSACSPDSTVSSLLTSCSIDSNNPYSNSLIHYKDKLYSSASEALEAYIEDFDLSLTSSEISTGKICICQSTPKQVKFSKHHAKEKHVLDDFNQLIGLGSLASPCRRQTECDPDLISLATDDLLASPADGSLPFVQRSPFKSRHQSSKRNRQSLQTSFCPCQTSSLNAESCFSLQENRKAVAHQNPHDDFSKKKCNVCTPDRYGSVSSKASSRPLFFEENSSTLPVKNYPRWLTSHKSDLSVSGISSIPSFHYPVWLKSLFSDSTKESDGQCFNTQGKASSSQTFEILKKRHSVGKDSSNFFEQNGCLDPRGDNKVEESCNCDSPDACFSLGNSFLRHTKKLSGDDPPELLTLKADRALESSTEDLSNTVENDGSPSTTDILGAERSWENAPGACKPPVPVCCEDYAVSCEGLPFPKADIIHKFLEDCLNDKNKENTFSGGHHHRPLEALKLMLFKLQAIQGSSSQNATAEQREEFETVSEKAEAELNLCDSEIIPLTNSIQKALHHLSCLKRLVEDNSNEQEQTDDHEEDKQEKG
ncbi:lung adenoma susceptibility protein 2 isoform X1 [Rissa tridactyla]|uniref:lung adenoma susceptibility protein 2 isoform X1 n=1 Tax=Rissa tridactyla TaxID=75485 RepID=UPI0023BA45BA|nr:lung adenoma susceptibility protein 2 isoform X1 [Rissa tridactyla]XP_054040434.1 lung adenoma susceptibility protein 2 isoform X1 [Rissa tridactyla]XP_054040435.1 lung adenoma susceptibility protein 2 isoform X1 [Rissa tridactyla]XP_054040436.1 lung adenoma susceptibility protein 2 isoform X1 [Rissa tridactyla]XP_054040437.1 lung adenoma susceptibility protein 2 isoform X1 [Rissa tridactyla]XP_054040438.1 lung adenoma susceptibility protein 2 isoform X1 [Rissa tridactyla]